MSNTSNPNPSQNGVHEPQSRVGESFNISPNKEHSGQETTRPMPKPEKKGND